MLAPPSRFQCILVYDISRWGRFQDVDERALQFICKQAGIKVAYCAEFDNDGSMVSASSRTSKVMAAEYSRELSARFTGGMPVYERAFSRASCLCSATGAGE
jgi:DNA invertase Pin-like site-specific DNA recombinase